MLKALPMLLVTLLASAAGPAQAGRGIYKCVLEGHTVYTETPCYSDTPELELPPVTVTVPQPAPSEDDFARRYDTRLAEEKADRARDDDIFLRQREVANARANATRSAVLSHRVVAGMDRSQVESAVGAPVEVRGNTHIHRYDGQRIRVRYGRDGLVDYASSRR